MNIKKFALGRHKKMTLRDLEKFVLDALAHDPQAYICSADGIEEDIIGMPLFDAPVFGAAEASDPMFARLRSPGVIGPHHRLPADWLDGAKSVVSFFLPFSAEVRGSNRVDRDLPSKAWLYARIEGQTFINRLCSRMQDFVRAEGHTAVFPSIHPEFSTVQSVAEDIFTSNWSERHTAYVCGLGTFGLSKGLITEKGLAGRFASFITDCPLPITPRKYSGVYDYCTRCGACVSNCPVSAISLETGKAHVPCAEYLQVIGGRFAPRYGCGKCQVGVPCEAGIPVFSPEKP